MNALSVHSQSSSVVWVYIYTAVLSAIVGVAAVAALHCVAALLVLLRHWVPRWVHTCVLVHTYHMHTLRRPHDDNNSEGKPCIKYSILSATGILNTW